METCPRTSTECPPRRLPWHSDHLTAGRRHFTAAYKVEVDATCPPHLPQPAQQGHRTQALSTLWPPHSPLISNTSFQQPTTGEVSWGSLPGRQLGTGPELSQPFSTVHPRGWGRLGIQGTVGPRAPADHLLPAWTAGPVPCGQSVGEDAPTNALSLHPGH